MIHSFNADFWWPTEHCTEATGPETQANLHECKGHHEKWNWIPTILITLHDDNPVQITAFLFQALMRKARVELYESNEFASKLKAKRTQRLASELNLCANDKYTMKLWLLRQTKGQTGNQWDSDHRVYYKVYFAMPQSMRSTYEWGNSNCRFCTTDINVRMPKSGIGYQNKAYSNGGVCL